MRDWIINTFGLDCMTEDDREYALEQFFSGVRAGLLCGLLIGLMYFFGSN